MLTFFCPLWVSEGCLVVVLSTFCDRSLYSLSLEIFAFFLRTFPDLLVSSYKPFPTSLEIRYGPSQTGSNLPPLRCFCMEFSSKTWDPTGRILASCLRSYVSLCCFCATRMFSSAFLKASSRAISNCLISSLWATSSVESSSSVNDLGQTSLCIGSRISFWKSMKYGENFVDACLDAL